MQHACQVQDLWAAPRRAKPGQHRRPPPPRAAGSHQGWQMQASCLCAPLGRSGTPIAPLRCLQSLLVSGKVIIRSCSLTAALRTGLHPAGLAVGGCSGIALQAVAASGEPVLGWAAASWVQDSSVEAAQRPARVHACCGPMRPSQSQARRSVTRLPPLHCPALKQAGCWLLQSL